jgi:hypothetical protein
MLLYAGQSVVPARATAQRYLKACRFKIYVIENDHHLRYRNLVIAAYASQSPTTFVHECQRLAQKEAVAPPGNLGYGGFETRLALPGCLQTLAEPIDNAITDIVAAVDVGWARIA